MALTFDESASAGISYDADGGYFDGPELIYLEPGGVGSVEGFGTAEFTLYVEAPPAIDSSEAFGTAELQADWIITANVPIASLESFGTPELVLAVEPAGIVSAELFGALLFYPQWQPNAVTPIASWAVAAERTDTWNKEVDTDTTWN